ncbi:MAG: LLM class flavin-dependent oxidoreductase [Dehalococcoidia bacterium]|nr:LLM class flavin-dependent oxidoreductase [Dehalococcoidia bacterium]
MQLGVHSGVAVFPGVTYDDAIDHLWWQARFADEAGFPRLWMVEHHFTTHAMTGATGAILAKYACLTTNIKIGYAVAVLPLHHPVRIAEEALWVDRISGGRVMFGVGPGFSALEYGVFGVPLERKREYLAESLDIVRKVFSGERFSHHGAIWTIPEMRIEPPPLRPGGPPIYMATSSHDSVARAARWDVHPLLGFRPNDVIADQIKLWRSVREEMGDSPEEIARKQREIGVLRRIVIGDTPDEAMEYALKGSEQFATAIGALNTANGQGGPAAIEQLDDSGRKVVMTLTVEEQRKRSMQNMLGGTIIGTKDQVLEQLKELEKTGVGHVLAGFGGAGMPLSVTRKNLEIVAREILPHFR